MLMSFHSEPIAGAEWAVPVNHFDAVLSEFQEMITKGDLHLPQLWFKKVHREHAWRAPPTRTAFSAASTTTLSRARRRMSRKPSPAWSRSCSGTMALPTLES